MTLAQFATLLAAVTLSIVHAHAVRLRRLYGIPRSRWLSMASGASVAYVFLYLLPELESSQRTLAEVTAEGIVRDHAYLVALLGMLVFYGLERMAATMRGHPQVATPAAGFWVHLVLFFFYNVVIGYLLEERIAETGYAGLAIFTSAMALHFLVNDAGLRHHHKHAYVRYGRWILAAGSVLGWALSQVTAVGDTALAGFVAFLAGAVILNSLKEELPAERESRFGAFVLGATIYALLLLPL